MISFVNEGAVQRFKNCNFLENQFQEYFINITLFVLNNFAVCIYLQLAKCLNALDHFMNTWYLNKKNFHITFKSK